MSAEVVPTGRVAVVDYAIVTGAYWAFTVTDGALRMLVLLHFHELGYSPVALGFLFLPYEFLGVVTNLFGGRLGSRYGLNRTLYAGLALQVVALVVLSFQDPGWAEAFSVAFVMATQALSGTAKDLTKMSSKSAVKLVAGSEVDGGPSRLFQLVSVLTGSKNALKGVGFFVGGALLGSVGFEAALRSMAVVLLVVLVLVVVSLRVDMGRAREPKPFGRLLSDSPGVNRLSAARFFLFGGRDVWFVVALPVFLSEELGWSFEGIGAFLAAWVIGYGFVQTASPAVLHRSRGQEVAGARRWSAILLIVTTALAIGLADRADLDPATVVVGGLILFGVVFAVNSAIHSYLILAYADADQVASEVGFYYSANAAGRLVGTLLSGVAYLVGGMAAALWLASAFAGTAWLLSISLPALDRESVDESTPGSARPLNG